MAEAGPDRAFNRGLRIVAGFAALVVVAVMILVVERDHPLQWDTRHNSPAIDRATVQTGDNGPLPRAGDAPTNTSGVVQHPGQPDSDLPKP